MDCNWPGSSLHELLQARILEWVAVPSLGGLPDPGIEPRSHCVSFTGRGALYHWCHLQSPQSRPPRENADYIQIWALKDFSHLLSPAPWANTHTHTHTHTHTLSHTHTHTHTHSVLVIYIVALRTGFNSVSKH